MHLFGALAYSCGASLHLFGASRCGATYLACLACRLNADAGARVRGWLVSESPNNAGKCGSVNSVRVYPIRENPYCFTLTV